MIISGSGIPIWLLVPGALAALGLVAYCYWRVLKIDDYGTWLPRTLLGLRAAAVFIAVMMVVNPILRINSSPRNSQRIAVLVDASRSMAVKDSIGGESRLDSARRVLNGQGVLSQLESLATTEVQIFDTNARPAELAKVAAVGEASDLFSALQSVREDKQKAPLAAVVVLSDGCETGQKSAAQLPADVPVYTVGLGSLHEALVQFPDVALAEVKADREAFVHTQIEAKLDLRETNLAGELVTVQIVRGNQILAEESITLQKDTTHASLKFTPTEPGLYDLEARVLPHVKEKITENNGRFFSVRVSGQKIRIFYYEGTPRWTYKYMLRELKRDPQLALQALLRTNVDALYQSSSAAASEGGGGPIFPSTREALKAYDCVILGDVRGSDLTPAQTDALKQHISEDGSGLILLAGKESFSAAGLPMLGLDVMMPASLASTKEITGAFNVSLTQDGNVHPAFGGLQKLLPISSVYTLGEPKPGAQVLARADGDKGSYNIALAQRYGNGRVFVFATDSDWNWPMKYKANEGDILFGRFWGQVIRWASNRQLPKEQQAAVTLSTDKDVYKIGETIHVYASGTDIANIKEVTVAEPLPLATATLAPGAPPAPVPESAKRTFVPSGDRLEAQFTAARSGMHRLAAGGATGEFLVERPAGEFDRLALNDALLRQLSSASGGHYFDATTARNLPETLKLSGKIKTEIREYVFDDSWLPLVLIVIALGVEWTLRKRMQVI
ncbi:MAG: hypothetical protein WCT04_04465 [Planctomycetota bacterium]